MGLSVFAVVAEAILALSIGQGTFGALVALTGLSPLLLTYNVLREKGPEYEQVAHKRNLAISRLAEVLLQSMPQGFFQGMIVLQMLTDPSEDALRVSWVQWASIATALFSVAFLIAESDRTTDTIRDFRRGYSAVHGYYPKDATHKSLVSLGVMLLVSGFLVNFWLVRGVLGSTQPRLLAQWLCCECVVLAALKLLLEGSLRFWRRGFEGVVPSIVVNTMILLSSLAAPCPLLRFPGMLGPSLFVVMIAYGLVVNPLMLFKGISLLDEKGLVGLPVSMLWTVLVVATLVAVLGLALMFGFMKPKYRSTFYKHHTIRQYVEELWEERTWSSHYGPGKDCSRADIVESVATWTWPLGNKVGLWMNENWAEWEEKPPTFFIDGWIANVARLTKGDDGRTGSGDAETDARIMLTRGASAGQFALEG